MANPPDNQDAARRQGAARHDSSALICAGVPAVIGNRTVWVTLPEQAALAAGTLPPSLQERLNRQQADDAVIMAMENAEELAGRPRPGNGRLDCADRDPGDGSGSNRP